MKSKFGPAANQTLNIWHRTFYKNCMQSKGYEPVTWDTRTSDFVAATDSN